MGSQSLQWIPTRNGFGEGMVLAGKKDKRVVALTADLAESTRFHLFAKRFPERFIEVGIAEQNLMGIAAGMALNGKIPFLGTYSVFCPGRNWDQLRVSVCYNNVNVKLTGAHAGLSVGPDGATHQGLEDIAITRCIPNLTVLSPCDYEQAKKAAYGAAFYKGPVYIRFARPATPVFTTPKTPFKIGKADIYWDTGDDVALIGTGPLVYECLLAAKELLKKKIKCKVVNVHTIKPLDHNMITRLAKRTKGLVVVEEHQKIGGLTSAVCESVCGSYPIPVESVSVNDRFGESGEHQELLEKYGLSAKGVVKAAQKILENL